MARRHDPGRRQRIIDAAIAVVARGGIGALSHRAVAAEADVPLGSTTYHFATLDELLVAALRQVNTGWLGDIERWAQGADPAKPLADELTRLVEELLGADRAGLELEYELYLTALRREAVRPIAAECLDEMTALLERRTADAATARALVALIDGLLLQFLLTGRRQDRGEIRTMLARVIG